MRILYKYLAHLHPAAFRRQFAAEMLWIFDETAASAGAVYLCWDCLVSLARQWLLRTGAWKVAVAVAIACVQMTAGGLIWVMLRHAPNNSAGAGDAALNDLMRVILWLVGGLVLMVIAASLWVNGFMARRTVR
jgi:hypothetical protein